MEALNWFLLGNIIAEYLIMITLVGICLMFYILDKKRRKELIWHIVPLIIMSIIIAINGFLSLASSIPRYTPIFMISLMTITVFIIIKNSKKEGKENKKLHYLLIFTLLVSLAIGTTRDIILSKMLSWILAGWATIHVLVIYIITARYLSRINPL